MKRGQVTFLIIPGGEHKVRELKLSASFIVLIFCLFLGGLAATAFLASEYREHRKNLGILAELEEKNRVQEEDLLLLMDKVARFEERIARLNDFERKIRIISNLDVPEEDENLFGVGGSASDEESTESRLEAAGRNLIDEMHRDVDILLQESSARERSFRELVEYLKTQKSELARTPSIWPVIGWVTSEFGNRKSPFTGKREHHNGIDIATRHGKEIVAPTDGVIWKVGQDRFMGQFIWIDHGYGVKTIYGHLHEQSVKAGQDVERGEVIGRVGSTGRSTGPHLHYGVMVDGEYVNPRRYLF